MGLRTRTKMDSKKRCGSASVVAAAATAAAVQMTAREVEASLPPPSRPAYHLAHAVKRAPSYLFAFIHVCYLHTLVAACYWYIVLPCVELRSAPNVMALYSHIRGMTTDLIITTLLPPQETRRWWRLVPLPGSAAASQARADEAGDPYMKGQIIVRQLWSSPATMFFLFGAAYFAVNALAALLRILYRSLRQLYRLHTGRTGEPAVSLYTHCRYGNGYDAALRLFFAVIELVWFLRYLSRYHDDGGRSYTYRQLSEVGGNAHDGFHNAPTVKAIAPAPVSATATGRGGGGGGTLGASSLLPLPSFAAGDLLTAPFVKALLVYGIQFILALTAVLDIQRLFHAIVGVRPLSVPNGWESCPLCGQNWKVSRRTANRVHICPQLHAPLLPPGGAATTPGASGSTTLQVLSNSDDDEGGHGHRHAQDGSPPPGSSGEVVPPLAMGHKIGRRAGRPGDAFPDPNVASVWSRLTYSWLNPLLNVALLSPFGTFSSPSPDAFPDGGDALWRAQLAIVARLPPLVTSWRTTEALGDPAWLLWKTRRRTPAEEAAIASRRGPTERGFLWATLPLRRVLVKAFVMYFLPPTLAPAPAPAVPASPATEGPPTGEGGSGKKRNLWRRLLWPFGRHESPEWDVTPPAAVPSPSSPSSPRGRAASVEPQSPMRRRLSRIFSLPSLRPASPDPSMGRSPGNNSTSHHNSHHNQQRTIKKSLFKLFLEHPCGREYVYRCVPYKILEDGLAILAPHAVRALVTFLREVGMVVASTPPRKKTGRERFLPTPGERYLPRGLFICAVLILVVFFQVLFFQAYLSHLYGAAMKATSALKTMLLRRALETPLALAAPSDQPNDGDDEDGDGDDSGGDDDGEDGAEGGDADADSADPGILADADDMNLADSTRLLARPQAERAGGDAGGGDSGDRLSSTSGATPSASRRRRKRAAAGNPVMPDTSTETTSSASSAASTASGKGGAATAASAGNAATPAAPPAFSSESEVVTLFTVDAGNCGDALIFLHNVWGHPLIILSSLVSMYSYVGWISTLVTFIVLVAMIPLNKMSATRVRTAQQQSKDSGARMGLLNAVLSSMRTVKAMALEGSIWGTIETARTNESDGKKSVMRAESVAAGQTELTTLLITLACFGTYLLTGGKMDAAVMVPTMAALNVMRFPLWTLPQIFSQVTRGYTSLQRIERYLEGGSRSAPSARARTAAAGARHHDPTCEASTTFRGQSFSLLSCEASSSPDSVEELNLSAAAGAGGGDHHHNGVSAPGTIHCERCSFAWSRQASVAHQQAEHNALAERRATLTPRSGGLLTPPPATAADRGSRSSSMMTGDPYGPTSSTGTRVCVLNNIHLHVNPGEFVVIQGATGSGKSALLMAMLDELHPMAPTAAGSPRGASRLLTDWSLMSGGGMARSAGSGDGGSPLSRGNPQYLDRSPSGSLPALRSPVLAGGGGGRRARRGFFLDGRVAYCAEVPWLRNQSIRENIRLLPDAAANGVVLEGVEEQQWYKRVLDACALTRDLASMPLGDRTVVGEGGSKLSGGQRARVALARAVYRRDAADMFLLDDILSALDVEVQKHLIAEVILGLLREEDPEEDDDDKENQPPAAQAFSAGDLEWQHVRPKRRKKTIILATHVAAEMLMPDRVFDMHTDGTLHEITTRRKPTQEHVNLQKEVWRMSAATAAAKSNAKKDEDAKGNSTAAGGESPQVEAASAAKAREPVAPARPAPQPLSSNRFSLLPNGDDLRRLFITYVGPRRALLVLVSTIIAQALQTFMDNWLGIWMSLHREEEDESFRAQLLRYASLPITLIQGSAANAASATDMHSFSYLLRAAIPGGAAATRLDGQSWWSLLVDVMYHRFVVAQDAIVLQFLFTYAVIGVTAAAFSFFRTRTFFLSFQRMTDALQLRAARALLRAPVSFFDRIPTSSLLHVLSRDQEIVDHSLGESTLLILFTVFQLSGMICFNTVQHSAFAVVVPLSALLFYHLTVRFLLLSKQVRTLESKLHGRSVAILKESVRGAVTLRAYGPQMMTEMEQELAEALDAVHTAGSAGLAADRWVALRLECVSIIMTSTLALLSVFAVCFSERSPKQKKVNAAAVAAAAAYAGLGINSSLSTARSLSLLCRRIGLFQNQYVSADALLRLERDTPTEKETMMGGRRRRRADRQQQQHSSESEGSSETDSSALSASLFESGEDEATAGAPRLLMDVRHLSAKYQPHLPWVLRDVTFKVRAGECVGLIGRTGNGKSSIFNALLQLMDVVKGDMFVNVAGLETYNAASEDDDEGEEEDGRRPALMMRHALSMSATGLRKSFFELVSQEPLLVQGTCRSNLLIGMDDVAPSPETDEMLWEVLQKVSLDEMLLATGPSADSEGDENEEEEDSDAKQQQQHHHRRTSSTPPAKEERDALLDFPISAGGVNLSGGQRQLLCLARALLHRPRIVLLDEVSSRVDKQTDQLIQRIIGEEILHRKPGQGAAHADHVPRAGSVPCGALIIAHRLETIISLCDRVLVVERGRCIANLTIDQAQTLADLETYL